jgi:phytanoyl-CoA hydroxylase
MLRSHAVIASSTRTAPIRKAQQLQFANQGFLHLPQLMDPAMTRRVRAAYDAAAARQIAPVRAVEKRRLYDVTNLFDEDRVFTELAVLPELLPYLISTVGEDVQLVQGLARLFPPGKTFTAPWHSDMANTLGIDLGHSANFHVKVHFYFEDLSRDQGCLAFLPGTHRLPREMERPSPEDITASDSVVIVPKAGDAVLFNTHCLHMCLDNTSPSDRRTLIYAYSHFWVKQFPGTRPTNLSWIPDGPLERQIFGIGVDGVEMFDQRPWPPAAPTMLDKTREHLGRRLLGRY